tara:strand:- start:945 stop:1166 length:222 start_codon:yes stop_codon:yes gene_type:complete
MSKQLDSKNEENSNELYTLLPNVIKQIDAWIQSSEEIAEGLRKEGMTKQAQTFTDYAQAYWNVKQYIEVNNVR